MYCSEVHCNKSVGIKQVEELIEKPGGAVIDKLDEVVDVIEVECMGLTWKTYRMVDNITCLLVLVISTSSYYPISSYQGLPYLPSTCCNFIALL